MRPTLLYDLKNMIQQDGMKVRVKEEINMGQESHLGFEGASFLKQEREG